MLNLSDKDLDRLSQEAAQQHEPGDIVGPRFWDKLEARLDRDLGKVNPNPARGIRRLPYYYAPTLLVLLGITWYFVRSGNKSHKEPSSGSPPLSAIAPSPADPLKPSSSSPNPVPADHSNSTPTAPSNTAQYPGTASAAASATGVSVSPAATPSSAATLSSAATTRPNASAPSTSTSTSNSFGASATGNAFGASSTSNSTGHHRHHNRLTAGAAGHPQSFKSAQTESASTGNTPGTTASTGNTGGTTASTGTPAPATAITTSRKSPHDLTHSAVRGPVALAHLGTVPTPPLTPIHLSNHNDVRHLAGTFLIGIMGGPDYASVSSVAGDRPGSTIGLTVDYQFASHWYIGSGLLFSRKVFAALPEDYHVPPDYYNRNNMGMGGGIDYVKGSFNMLEVPLNLRYDFSTVSSTLFFLSAGTSSYFFPQENCGYYFDFYNPRTPAYKQFNYANQPSDLFATINLSMGAEFGISNSLSALVAPYVKIPTRGIGFGQVQLNSFGLGFSLRYAPVRSHHRY